MLSSSDSSDIVVNNEDNRVMRDSEIMMIIRNYELNRNYEINKEKLRKDFMSPKYDDKRIWFFNTFSKKDMYFFSLVWT